MPKKKNKGTVSIKVSERLADSGLMSDLESLAADAEDADHLEKILLNTIKSIYKSLPDGKRLYSGEHSLPIKLERFSKEGFVYVECVVSELEPNPIAIEEGAIATIYFWDMTYSISCNWLPIDMTNRQRLIEDTEKVMKYLGLRKVKARNI